MQIFWSPTSNLFPQEAKLSKKNSLLKIMIQTSNSGIPALACGLIIYLLKKSSTQAGGDDRLPEGKVV